MAKRKATITKEDTITLKLEEFLDLISILVRMLPRRQREYFIARFAELAKAAPRT